MFQADDSYNRIKMIFLLYHVHTSQRHTLTIFVFMATMMSTNNHCKEVCYSPV